MDIKEFSALIKSKRKELDILMRHRMPVIAGRMAKDHFQDNFRKGGFVNNGLHPWKVSARLQRGGKGAADNYGTLLSGRNHLFSSIKYVPSDYRVKILNALKYASVHNFGGTVRPTVTPQMRRFAWAKYYEAAGKRKKITKSKKRKDTRKSSKIEMDNQEAFKWKRLALTKKKQLEIRIPQRRFLGDSKELSEKIAEKQEREIRNILNL